MKNFPTPQQVKNIREFVGLSKYYRRFIKNYAKITEPLNILLEKDEKFIWGIDQEKAFNNVKEALCIAPVLQYPRFDEPLIITTDASNFVLGAVLSQCEIGKDTAVAYASKSLLRRNLNITLMKRKL